MKKITILSLIAVVSILSVKAQSKSYEILREKFRGQADVVSFSTSGFLARTVLWISGENDYLDAIRDIRHVRFSVIPESAFKKNNVTLGGFKKIALKDGFEELANVKQNGDDVTLLLQTPKQERNNRYLLLVDSNTEIVVMEITGYIDPRILLKDKDQIAFE